MRCFSIMSLTGKNTILLVNRYNESTRNKIMIFFFNTFSFSICTWYRLPWKRFCSVNVTLSRFFLCLIKLQLQLTNKITNRNMTNANANENKSSGPRNACYCVKKAICQRRFLRLFHQYIFTKAISFCSESIKKFFFFVSLHILASNNSYLYSK